MTVVGMTPGRKEGFSELSVISSICSNLLQTVQAFLQLVSFMSIQTRSKARKREMTSDSADSSCKLDEILVKMDALNTAKNDMLTKLNTLGLA